MIQYCHNNSTVSSLPCHIKREYAVQVFQVDELMIICKGCLGSDAHDLADLQRTGRIKLARRLNMEFVVRLQEELNFTGTPVCLRKNHLMYIIINVLL